MSDSTDGPAFPRDHVHDGHNGMTLRDYFAAKAMAGFLAHPEQDYAPLIDNKAEMMAKDAYYVADAMLKERAK